MNWCHKNHLVSLRTQRMYKYNNNNNNKYDFNVLCVLCSCTAAAVNIKNRKSFIIANRRNGDGHPRPPLPSIVLLYYYNNYCHPPPKRRTRPWRSVECVSARARSYATAVGYLTSQANTVRWRCGRTKTMALAR